MTVAQVLINVGLLTTQKALNVDRTSRLDGFGFVWKWRQIIKQGGRSVNPLKQRTVIKKTTWQCINVI